MKIILNGIEYAAPAPMVGLWRKLQKLKAEHKQRVKEIEDVFITMKPYESIKKLEGADQAKFDALEESVYKKIADNKNRLLETSIDFIVETFKNDAVTSKSIDDYMLLQDVQVKFAEINSWLSDLFMGMVKRLPNEQTPTE